MLVMGGVWAENVICNCQAIGFTGSIWAVHPHKKHLADIPAYRTIEQLPSPPDICFLAINRHACVDAIAQLAAINAGGVICFASGFAEAGEDDLQQRLIAAAGDMPVLGPNCYGYINYNEKLALWPDQHGGQANIARGVAIFSQSSNIAINLTMQSRGLPIAQIMCLGNQAMVTLQEIAHESLHDERISALGFYIEGIQQPTEFAELIYQARSLNKPVIVIKSGLSPIGQITTQSHTASLAGNRAASLAFLQQSGAIIADSLEEFLELLKLAHMFGETTHASNFCSVSCSGGEAALMADLFDQYGVSAPMPSPKTTQQLQHQLGSLVNIRNPLDYHTFIWGERKKIALMLSTLLQDYDILLMVIDFPRSDRCNQDSFMPAAQAMIDAYQQTQKPIVSLASLSENIDETLAHYLFDHGIAALCGLETGIKASMKFFGRANNVAFWQPLPTIAHTPHDLTFLPEHEAKKALQTHDIAVPQFLYADDIASLRHMLSYPPQPWVLKGMGLAHKTEAHAIRLDIKHIDQLEIMEQAQGYLLEEMISGAIAEMLICVRYEPVYGISLTMGQGGIYAELFADTQTLILPCDKKDILNSLKKLRLFPLLTGYRGQPKADLDAIIEQIQALCQALQYQPDWQEIEINPMIITPTRAVCVDALISVYRTKQ